MLLRMDDSKFCFSRRHQVVMWNVIRGQMFLECQRFLQNLKENEKKKKTSSNWMIILLLLHQKSDFCGVSGHPWHLGRVFCFALACPALWSCTVCTICTISSTDVHSSSKRGIKPCLVQKCNHILKELAMVQVPWVLHSSQTDNPTSFCFTDRSTCKHTVKR